jgi:hypothetical protein
MVTYLDYGHTTPFTDLIEPWARSRSYLARLLASTPTCTARPSAYPYPSTIHGCASHTGVHLHTGV